MSANTSSDVSLIKDEDVLRKMWQDTEDFGRKKEIRSHMYKLREARLREFYNTGEANTEIKHSIRTTESSNNKSNNMTTHADSLADHSFLSLKSKEIRDSESPTRDVAYKISDKPNQGWSVVSSDERSIDGKRHTTSHLATTSGTEKIDGGKIDYAAQHEQKGSVYQDCDEKNFIKSVGTSSNSVIRQEAVTGDEHSNVRASTTKTSSSSRMVTESKSSSGDIIENLQILPASTNVNQSSTVTRQVYSQQVPSNTEDSSTFVSRKVFTTNVPNELKNHPNYFDGNTKVTQETRTLADGTVVTTTKYETKRGNSTETSTTKKYSKTASSTSEQKFSSTSSQFQSSNRTVKDSRRITDNNKAIEYIVEPRENVDINVKITRDDKDKNQDVRSVKRVVNEQVNISRDNQDHRSTNVNESITKQVKVVKQNQDIRTNDERSDRNIHIQNHTEHYIVPDDKPVRDVVPITEETTVIYHEPRENVDVSYSTTSTTTVRKHDVHDSKKFVNDQFIETERRHEKDTRTDISTREEQPRKPSPQRPPAEKRPKEIMATPEPSIKHEPEQAVKPSPQHYPKSAPEQFAKSPPQSYAKPTTEQSPRPSPEPYEQPERRQPIKPGKSDLDQRPKPTEGQYDTTYRTEFTNKRISVDVSATHDAFARSLRAVTPERIGKSTPRSGSASSLRNSTSPEKNRHPSRVSPDRQSRGRSSSPRKSTDRFSSNETITYTSTRSSPEKKTPRGTPERTTDSVTRRRLNDNISVTKTAKTESHNTDTITRRKKVDTTVVTNGTDTSTITRRKKQPRSRSQSPTGTTTSDFEYVRHTSDIITDLDDETTGTVTRRIIKDTYDNKTRDTRPSTLEITNKKNKKVSERSPTSPLTEPRKSPTRKTSLRSPTKEQSPIEKSAKPPTDVREIPKDRPLKRTDTYEERVKQILGITNETSERRRSSLERNSLKRSSFTRDTTRTPTGDSPKRITSPTKDSPDRSPLKETPPQGRRSPVKEILTKRPDQKSPVKEKPKINEFPSQVRRSPDKKEPSPYPEKKSVSKEVPSKISEFPSQIRKSPEKEPLPKYPERKSPSKEAPKISEFPSQIRKSPEKEPLSKYLDKKSPTKETPKISEFPSQYRKTPDEEPLESYPTESDLEHYAPEKQYPEDYNTEFISEIRKTLEEEGRKCITSEQDIRQFDEYDTQKEIRKNYPEGLYPEQIPSGTYPEKTSPKKVAPSVQEFPSQVRKSPEKQPLEPYPERTSPRKEGPSVQEFSSQIRKSPEKQPLEPYPEKTSPRKEEFPSQVRKSPEKQTLEPYPEKTSPRKEGPSVQEFPSQVRKSPEKQPYEPYPEKTSPRKEGPSVQEFPSQVRKSSEKQPREPYPEKTSSRKEGPSVQEFPSQVRKSPEKQPREPYPEKTSPRKEGPSVQEFPSQVRKSQEKQPLERYPEKMSPKKDAFSVPEFPSQIRRQPEREPLEPYPEKHTPKKDKPSSVSEFPSQTRKSPEKQQSQLYPDKKKTPKQNGTIVSQYPSSKKDSPVRKSKVPGKHPEEESSTEEEDNVEEIVTETTVTKLETRIPVDEQIITKKFISELCREEELERTDINKKTTEELLEEEITQNEGIHDKHKTVKKDQPEKPKKKSPKVTDVEEFIKTETDHTIRSTTTRKDAPKEKSPIKKPLEKTPAEKTPTTKTVRKDTPKISPGKKQPETFRTEKTKFTGETEYTDEYCKTTKSKKGYPKKPQGPIQKITLNGVEDLSEEDNTVQTRTHRIDDTIDKRTTTRLIKSNDVTKSKPKETVKHPSPVKKPLPKQESPTKKPGEIRQRVTSTATTQSRFTTTAKKTIVQSDNKTKIDKTVVVTKPKKHVVTATITVSPKSKPVPSKPAVPKTISSKTVTTVRTHQITQPKSKKPIQNGHVSSDTEEESVTEVEEITTDVLKHRTRQEKITRTTSDQIIKTPKKSPLRGHSKPELISPEIDSSPIKPGKRPEKKCITTKTVIINNKDLTEREFIVDLQRSKSSREPSPDRICPRPVTSDDEENVPRYPDEVTEPDDNSLRRKPKKLSDIPIIESEDTIEFSRVTEVRDAKKITDIDKVEETDESLLSVNKKINRFLNTASELTKEPLKPKSPKIDRPTLVVTEDLKSDECLLSVSDKVSKFITTAEELITPQNVQERPKSPKCRNYPSDDLDVNVSQKITNYLFTTEEETRPRKVAEGPVPKVPRQDLSQVDETIKNDECLLSVSDKVTKFISTAEKLTTKKPVSLSKIEKQPLPKRESDKLSRSSPSRHVPTECVQIETEEQTYTRKSPERYSPSRRSPSPKLNERTPDRRTSNQYKDISKTEITEIKYPRRDTSPKLPDSTPKSTKKPTVEEPKTILSSIGRLRSTETVKKAKALFENISKEQEILKQREISGKRVKTPEKPKETKKLPRTRLEYSDNEEEEKSSRRTTTTKSFTSTDRKEDLKSTKLVMEKIRPRSKSPETISHRPKSLDITRYRGNSPEKVPESRISRPRERSTSPNDEIPHYMTPLEKCEVPETTVQYKPRNRGASPSGEIPHYMTPLERPEIPVTKTWRPRDRSVSPSGEIPHYMTPLERPEVPETKPSRLRNRGVSPSGEIPHYMTPIDRPDIPDTTTTRPRERGVSPSDGIPHYMTPLEKCEIPETKSSRPRDHDVLPRGEIPHYMTPIEKHEVLETKTWRSERTDIHDKTTSRPRGRGTSPTGEVPHYMTPLERPEVPETKTWRPRDRGVSPGGEIPHYMTPLEKSESPDTPTRRPEHRSTSPRSERPHYMKPLDRFKTTSTDKMSEISANSSENIYEHRRDRGSSPEGDVPHYMKPLDRSLKPRSPHRESIEKSPQPEHPEEDDTRITKFGVTLKRTDSGKAATSRTSTVTERRKSSITLEKRITEEEIEDIFELEILEELLEKVVGYELRRKIRGQIRLVKKLISENTLSTYIAKRKRTSAREVIDRREPSPPKRTQGADKVTEYQTKVIRKTAPDNKQYRQSDVVDKREKFEETTEYKSSYSYKERKTSSDYTKVTRKSQSPVRERSPEQGRLSPERRTPSSRTETRVTTNRPSPDRKTTKTVESTPYGTTTTVKTREHIPGGSKTTTTKTTEVKSLTSLKKTLPASKTIDDDKPEWVKQRNLRKTSESTVPTTKKVTTSTIATATKKSTETRSHSPSKDIKPTDIITSSYGVGPTDENGTPLFGLRALRAQNKSDSTKVQGTVIRSEYYSENGEEPVGEVSITKYSTDPKDLGRDGTRVTDNKGLTSITTTQKFGYKDTPSLRSLTNKNKEICDTNEKTTKTTKVTRRGSVKALSQKFIDNAVETLKGEKQTTYPKAGLILRTSSFKDTGSGTDDSREEYLAETESSVTERSTSTRVSGGHTFLTNKSRVSGVQDVITRMKTEGYEEGDTEEDIRARGLLNKFIGSQVILSGMESHVSTSSKTTSSVSPNGTLRKSTEITSTVTKNGKPSTSTRVFNSPVTEQELETVWEEQTLRLLLEQSTEYEERRIIRARLRQVMAEQEACTELVDKASEDQQPTGKIEEKVEVTKETVSKSPVTTTQVTRVTTQQAAKVKPMSPFAKFRQLDKQNSLNKSTPSSTPGTPKTPGTPGSAPLFKFTDPAVSQSASTIKERLLHWCRMKTKEYENIQLDNFSTSWADGLAFCALIHHFLPDAFDYHALTPKDRRHNFELAFKVADEKADIAPLLDVDDMVETRRPDWKCVFTYVQSIYRRFKDED